MIRNIDILQSIKTCIAIYLANSSLLIRSPCGYIEDSEIFRDGNVHDVIHILYNTSIINGYIVINLVKECGFSIVAKDKTRAIIIFGNINNIKETIFRVIIEASYRVRVPKAAIVGFYDTKYILSKKLEPSREPIMFMHKHSYTLKAKRVPENKFLDTWTIEELIETYKNLGN